ncbi:MAG: hypothetical protein ABI563_11660 [Specibacter sp.]
MGITLAVGIQHDPLIGCPSALLLLPAVGGDAQPVAARINNGESAGGSLLSAGPGDAGDAGQRELPAAAPESCCELLEKASRVRGPDDDAPQRVCRLEGGDGRR